MRHIFTLFCLAVFGGLFAQSALINEINYLANDPSGHGIEVVAAAGEDLDGWSLLIYTADGLLDRAIDLSNAFIPNQSNGYGTVWYDVVQNDGGNGAALADPTGTVTQFVSYGNAANLLAGDGAAAGQTADYLGSTPVGGTLSLVGSSLGLGSFNWLVSMASSPGSINTDQIFLAVYGRSATGDLGVAHIFPNPFVREINVRFHAPVTSSGTLSLYDLNGVRHQQLSIQAGTISASIKIGEHLPAGTYFVKMDSPDEQWVKAVVR